MAGEPESVMGGPKATNSCTIEERRVGDVAILAVAGTLDVLTAPELEARIKAAAATSPAAVIVDLGRVDFLERRLGIHPVLPILTFTLMLVGLIVTYLRPRPDAVLESATP